MLMTDCKVKKNLVHKTIYSVWYLQLPMLKCWLRDSLGKHWEIKKLKLKKIKKVVK